MQETNGYIYRCTEGPRVKKALEAHVPITGWRTWHRRLITYVGISVYVDLDTYKPMQIYGNVAVYIYIYVKAYIVCN